MTSTHSLVVIAGLDPAIRHNGAGRTSLDHRVKPGDDTGVARSDRNLG
jgi:hypothetical protein